MLMLAMMPMGMSAQTKLEKTVTYTGSPFVGGIALSNNSTPYATAPCFCTNDGNIYTIKTLGTDGLVTLAELTLPSNTYQLKDFESFSNQGDKLAGIFVDNGTDTPTYLFLFRNYNYNFLIVNNEGKILYSDNSGEFSDANYCSELQCIGIEKSVSADGKSVAAYTFIPIADLLAGNISEAGSVTGNNSANATSKVYNLQGMEVDENTKGIVIKNGSAILNK